MTARKIDPPSSGSALQARLAGRTVDTNTAEVPPTFAPEARPAPVPVRIPAERGEQQQEPWAVKSRKQPAVEPPARTSTEMDRRSWYMPKASADALAALVEELHWETRQPKQAVLAALVEVAVQHRDQVAKKLKHK